MKVVKIQDTGESPLSGRQEQYWNHNLRPRYEKLRPGFKLNYTNQETILKLSGFKAFEYGHWTTQNDRFDFLAAALVSFSDMKKITGFDNLGFDKIGVAYGARGKGGKVAAHFEPHSYMINLTKPHGFGCFAHEYGHAIDYFFGGYIDPDGRIYSLSGGRLTGMNFRTEKTGSLRYYMKEVLLCMLQENGKPSESYRRLLRYGGENDYWVRHTELFARIFEQWTLYRLKTKKIENHFLTQRKYSEHWAYLTDKDFKRVLPKMNRLIREIAAKSAIRVIN